MYYVVTYRGQFGYIKPWTAVRDSLTYSQQFLTPSIVEGMEKKLFPEMLDKPGKIERIARHKLQYSGISEQAETTCTRGLTKLPRTNLVTRGNVKGNIINFAPLTRGVMIYPVLYLAFYNESDAREAATQHLCLCRNEDIVLPDEDIVEMSEQEFNALEGFELRFGDSEHSFPVGYSRFDGELKSGHIENNGIALG